MSNMPSWSDLVSNGVKAIRNLPSMTYNAFVGKFNEVRDGARLEKDRSDAYAKWIATLRRKAGTIRNATNKANALKAISHVEASHRASVNMMMAMNNAMSNLFNATRDFLKKNSGLVAPKGLNGLESPVVIIPVVIVGLVFLAGFFVQHVKLQNDRIKMQLDERAQVVDAMLRGQITPAQGGQIVNELEIKDSSKDPLGLTNTFQSLTPIVLAVAAIMIVPQMLKKGA